MGIGKELGDDGRFGDDFILDGSAAVGVAEGGHGSALLDRRGRRRLVMRLVLVGV